MAVHADRDGDGKADALARQTEILAFRESESITDGVTCGSRVL